MRKNDFVWIKCNVRNTNLKSSVGRGCIFELEIERPLAIFFLSKCRPSWLADKENCIILSIFNPFKNISTFYKLATLVKPWLIIKVGLLSSKKLFYFFNENPLKVMKNAFCFTLKALFLLKILKFLFWHFGHVENTG